ncbi:putative ATP-dependent helicase C17A2.12-like protein 2 [Colletotrichum chlorophyti]|uniref:Putative ATP-dependent helicase C17A2.12-like protein 2 n=1 Tax=Colletotrichum chlorophyti TaxID=708187 RepID=A0A1Q8S2V5_9PEZI|nr:putative ATP-dependent helicase C17A2.12-like protein 2 [Colletotrichum chlorophyti]
MKAIIHDWQLCPASWMVQRENASARPYGGILADQMGMGKTVTSLTLVVGNPPSREDAIAGRGATLVVVSGHNVVKQWHDKILEHVECIQQSDICIFRRAKNSLPASQIARHKVVITTFQELLRYPSDSKLEALKTKCDKDGVDFEQAVKATAGPLFDIDWYRVVFDELHTIKNVNSQTFRSCYHLKKRNVWGLSGTPLINRGKEIFPYLKLIGVEGIETRADYTELYEKSINAKRKLDALINLVTYRRTHDDKFLGRDILQGLTPFEAKVRWIDLSKEEELIYHVVRSHYGNLHPPSPIVAMTHLRRAISHPYLLEKFFREDIDTVALKDLIPALKELEGKQWVYHQIGNRFGPNPMQNDGNSSDGAQQVSNEEHELTAEEEAYRPMSPFGKSAFGQDFAMAKLLEYTVAEKETAAIKCGVCHKKNKIQPMKIQECGHVFCNSCIAKFWQRRLPVDKCPACGIPYDASKAIDVEVLNAVAEKCDEEEESESEPEEDERTPRKKKAAAKRKRAEKKREKRKAARRRYGGDFLDNLPILEEEDSAYLNIGISQGGGVPCAGAKLSLAKEIILQWQQEAPDDKIIIFIEFIKTATLLGILLNLEDIPFVYLNGKVTAGEKLKAVDAFKYNKQVKILVRGRASRIITIASMKVGGQALNLTCANRIILVDSWWNEAAHEQANGRINRIGQHKHSYAIAIKARGTIDEHIQNLQDQKTAEIREILQDDGRVTEVFHEYETMALTAPGAWQDLKKRLLAEIAEEDEERGV